MEPASGPGNFPNSAMEATLMDVHQAARILHMSTSWLYKQAENRLIQVVRVGGSVRFRKQDLEEFVAARIVRPRRNPIDPKEGALNA